ncbi:hypothetical protein G3M48_003440 [Beauveria asiatica]|uniref:Uncharacterized protein n=1 Tax=Beauveria asiatica TaxID=1069075 RepID=A0AAW0RW25_9HYPO
MKVSTTSFLLASLYGSAWTAPIGGDLVGDALGNVAPVNDLTESLTGAVGQPGSIVGRDGEQKASAVLPKYTFVATDHTADVDIRADATNVDARNLHAEEGIVSQLADVDAKTEVHPFPKNKTPAEIYLDTLVDASNRDITADSVAHQTAGTVADQTVDAEADPNVHARNLDVNFKGMGQPANVKVHPFHDSPVNVKANVVADADGATDIAKATDSV